MKFDIAVWIHQDIISGRIVDIQIIEIQRGH